MTFECESPYLCSRWNPCRRRREVQERKELVNWMYSAGYSYALIEEFLNWCER